MRIGKRHVARIYSAVASMLHVLLLSLNANYYIYSDIQARAESAVTQMLATQGQSASAPSATEKTIGSMSNAAANESAGLHASYSQSARTTPHESASMRAYLMHDYSSRVFTGMVLFLLCQIAYSVFTFVLGLYADQVYARLLRSRLLHRSVLRQTLLVFIIALLWAASFLLALWPPYIPGAPPAICFILILCVYDVCASLCQAAVNEIVCGSSSSSSDGSSLVSSGKGNAGEPLVADVYSDVPLDGNINEALERCGAGVAMVVYLVLSAGVGLAHYLHDASSSSVACTINPSRSSGAHGRRGFHYFLMLWSAAAVSGLVLCFLCLNVMQSRQQSRKHRPTHSSPLSVPSLMHSHASRSGSNIPPTLVTNSPTTASSLSLNGLDHSIFSSVNPNDNGSGGGSGSGSGKAMSSAAVSMNRAKIASEAKRNTGVGSMSSRCAKRLRSLHRFALQTTHRPCMKAVMVMWAWQQYTCTLLSQLFIVLLMYACGDSVSLPVRVLTLTACIAAPYALAPMVAALCGALGKRTAVTLLLLLRVIVAVAMAGMGASLLQLSWAIRSGDRGALTTHPDAAVAKEQQQQQQQSHHPAINGVATWAGDGHTVGSALAARSRNSRVILGIFMFVLRLVTESIQSAQSAVMRDVVDEDMIIFGHTKPRDAAMQALLMLVRRPLKAAALVTGYLVVARCSIDFDDFYPTYMYPSVALSQHYAALKSDAERAAVMAVQSGVAMSAHDVHVLPSVYANRVLYYTATARSVALYIGVICALTSIMQLVMWLRHYNLHGSHLHFVKMATQKIYHDRCIKYI